MVFRCSGLLGKMEQRKFACGVASIKLQGVTVIPLLTGNLAYLPHLWLMKLYTAHLVVSAAIA